MKESLVLHPFLFAIFPILFLFSHNAGKVAFSETLLPSAIVLTFTLLLLLLSRLILRDIKRGGILVSISLLLFFSYGHVLGIIQGWELGGFLIGHDRYLLLTWGIIFTCGTYFIIKTRKNLHSFTTILNIVAFSLVVISLINIGAYKFKTRDIWQDSRRTEHGETSTVTVDLEDAGKLRDIYYIILDGYARSDNLREFFDYDNHEFIDYLTEKGFYIASKSRPNYVCTYLSMASSLNMEYINYLTDMLGEESQDMTALYRMITDNKVMRFLKSKGYSLYVGNTDDIWEPKNVDNDAIVDIDCSVGYFSSLLRKSEFAEMLICTSMLNPFMGYLVGNPIREQILCMFSKIPEVREIEGPKFIYAHIPCPHPPYIFGRNGERTKEAGSTRSNWNPKWQYLDQLIFVNKKAMEMIDKLLSQSDISPIVILQADHGPAFFGNRFHESVFKERMRILNAYYLPGIAKGVLYESITPANTFRLIFDNYFGASYGLLEDKVYFSDTDRSWYKFIDVTDKIK